MRVVFLLERPSQFDAPLFRLAHQDQTHQFEAWFLDPNPGGEVFDPEIGGTVHWGSDPTVGYDFRLVPKRGSRTWFERHLTGVDFLIVNGYTRRPYLRAAWQARLCSVASALRIDTVRFPGDAAPSLLRRQVVRRGLGGLFGRFLTTGTLGRQFLGDCGIAAERIGRFPYAVDHAAFEAAGSGSRAEHRARWGLSGSARVVLSLAKFTDREAPWDLVEVCRSLTDVGDAVIVLAGEGPLRERFVSLTAGLRDVLLPGYVPYSDLPSLYAAADVLVHAAREERWGVSVAEALACGLPVVTSHRVGSGYDLLRPGENGGRYFCGDISALRSEILHALTLDRGAVREASAQALAEFGLASTWQGIISTAVEVRR